MRRLLFYGVKVHCCIYRSMRWHILVSVLQFTYLTSSPELMIGCKLHFLMFGYTPQQRTKAHNVIAKLCKSKALKKFAKRPRTAKKYRTAVVFASKSSFEYICRKNIERSCNILTRNEYYFVGRNLLQLYEIKQICNITNVD